MESDENAPKNGQQTNGFFYTTMLHHPALIVRNYLATHSVTTLKHPRLYSANLAPSAFYQFPRMKKKLKKHRFKDSDCEMKNATKLLKDISKDGFKECFKRGKKFVDPEDKYF